MKMTDQLSTIYEEIKIWERVSHIHVVKIFELFDDKTVPDIYLLMERAQYGQI